jgi:glycerol kinase
VVRPDGSVQARHQQPVPVVRPMPGLVELDGAALARAMLDVAKEALSEAGPVAGVGVTNQRGTTLIWDAASSEPIGPVLSWQDLRTAGTCLELQAEGLRLAPNESATKLAWLLDTYDPDRRRDVRFGTLDSWMVWQLTGGQAHLTDLSNAALSGLLPTEGVLVGSAELEWDPARLERFRVPEGSLPVIVPSSAAVAEASALPGSPPICSLVGDQQASLFGQGCVHPGDAKGTFGTGAFLDVNIGGKPPAFGVFGKRGEAGCFPIVGWQRDNQLTWGVEAIMLSAGTALSWLVEDLGLLASPAESAEVASQCSDTGDVFFVPALLGIGTPLWDFGARTLLVGMTAGTGRPQVVRAVLEGIAQRGADLLEAAEIDSGLGTDRLRVDGGMSANPVFVQALADACHRPVEVSVELEATTFGAGLLAGLAAGTWSSEAEAASLCRPRSVVEPAGPDRRDRWAEARRRAEKWIPELSALSF